MAKKDQPYWNRKVRNERPTASLSHTTLTKQRGLKGTKLGPANEGRTLSPEEKVAAIAKMKTEGKL